MKTRPVNQEILLMTTTTFSQREWCNRDTTGRPLSVNDRLEEACWNGLLDDMLPGIVEKSACGEKLSLWQITHFSSFLDLELSEAPTSYNEQLSVNPYLFVPTLTLN